MLLGCDRITILGITAMCDEASGFQVCGSLAALPNGESRVRGDLIVLSIIGLVEEESALRCGAIRGRCPLMSQVLLQREDACQRFPLGTRCAVGMDDTAREWMTTFGAALEGAIHFGAGMSALDQRTAETAREQEDPLARLLSRSEMELVNLTRQGLMPLEISRRLGRSVKTVEAHYHRIKVKLGLRTIGELRAYIS